jgi:regulator of sirC expression with transglutaminase-like and TPR domain
MTDGAAHRRPESAAEGRLAAIGRAPEAPFDLAEAALMLASLDRPRVPLERYRQHLADLAGAVAGQRETRESAAGRARALAAVIRDAEGYSGDELTYDDLQNANLIRVIDRRRGLPVALGILYVHAARAQGWHAFGLNFPGHFLVAVECGAERVILDPFAGIPLGGASDLRAMLKAVAGNGVELTPACYAPLDDRRVLLRLQNNIKTRLAAQGRFAEAVAAAERMLLIVPEETSLHRDLGLYHAEAGNLGAALDALQRYLDLAEDDEARHDAAALVQRIRARLN